MRVFLAAAVVLIAAADADAALPAQVKRGDLEVRIKVTGTVVPDDIFHLKATIEGRVESVLTSTYVWRKADQPLAFLASKELAAMLDSKGAQDADILEERWGSLYRSTPVRCPHTCFILKSFMKAKSLVKPQAVLFEATRSLKMVARVRLEDAPWIHDGQELVFWPVKDPKLRRRRRIARFVLDIQGEKVSPGGSFVLSLSPDNYLEPGTEWEGEIVPMSKKDVLIVPTSALIHYGDAVYLPIRVSTGITTQALTHLTGGIEEKMDILILADSQLNGVERHKQEVDLDALRQRELERRKAPAEEHGADYGEDPYAEP